ncbi:MAG: hypothetical protein IJN34_08920 [Clostridia bacterium]|nr:hypothetical protein [Clostridia bacterium]
MKKKDLLKEPYPINLIKTAAYNRELDVPEALSIDILAGVQYVLSLLDERQQEVLRQRYQERKSYAKIAESFSVTKERICQLEYQAFVKLRKPYNWNFLQYGVWGYMEHLYKEAYQCGYNEGYTLGYRSGVHDERIGILGEGDKPDPMKQPIVELHLSVRALNCLRNAGFTTLGEICALDLEQIQKIKSLGITGRMDVAGALHRLGIRHTDWEKYL